MNFHEIQVFRFHFKFSPSPGSQPKSISYPQRLRNRFEPPPRAPGKKAGRPPPPRAPGKKAGPPPRKKAAAGRPRVFPK